MDKIAAQHPLLEQIGRLRPLVDALLAATSEHEKLQLLNAEPRVEDFIQGCPHLQTFLAGLTPACDAALKSVIAIGQGPVVFQQMDSLQNPFEKIRALLDILLPVDKFYEALGGIAGYHLTVLRLIAVKEGLLPGKEEGDSYSKPAGTDLAHPSPTVDLAVRCGIESMPRLAEIYPVGGAGDRLQLRDEYTGELLPVAQMRLCGLNLLEWLIRDLQAREFLYYKLTGRQVVTPVAMMTSHEKRNHERIVRICEERNWFGRPKESFRFFTQPLVPMISVEGNWCLSAPLQLMVKPGGHGALWKIAHDEGVFAWLKGLGRRKALVRQINNPIAGIDLGLLAFAGVGFLHDKAFGFASCPRAVNAAEGMNILLERTCVEGVACAITNIEYTDFAHKGVADVPAEPGGKYSVFPANTNILFADLHAVEAAANRCPIPGTMLNMKNVVECLDAQGRLHQVHGGRLESMMQNIADEMTDTFPAPIDAAQQEQLKTFLTYNRRHRTISVTKKSHTAGQPLLETPEGCYYDLQRNAHELLAGPCGVEMPHLPAPEEFASHGPTFLAHLHPALGPVFDIIAQKIRGGSVHKGAELSIDAAEVDIENIDLCGALLIRAQRPVGQDGEIGRCTLKRVAVKNKGIDWSAPQKWWKGDIERTEALEIILEGNGEFHAEDVSFAGGMRIVVPDGWRYTATMREGALSIAKGRISASTWLWAYEFSTDNKISLSIKEG